MIGKQKGIIDSHLLAAGRKLLPLAGLLIIFSGALFSFGCDEDSTTETGPKVYTVSPLGGTDFISIQVCILAANFGDTCLVLPGTYRESLRFWGKAITVGSLFGPEYTILDGQENGTVVHFMDNEQATTVFTGFTITNGSAQTNPADAQSIEHGGGVKILSASPAISNCIIKENQADGDGGGMWIFATGSKPKLTDITFQDNQAGGSGGGLAVFRGMPYLKGCIFYGNDAENDTDNGYGGAISTHDEAEVTLFNGLIFDNSADYGGAVSAVRGAQVNLASATVTGNSSDISAGAMYLQNAVAELDNSIFWNNTTGAGAATTDPIVMDFDTLQTTSTELYLSAIDLQDGVSNVGQTAACAANAASCPAPFDDGPDNSTFSADPLFVPFSITDTTDERQGFYLSQTATGRADQTGDSPCIDRGNTTAAGAILENRTTRTDRQSDEGDLDLGYHY